jgi:hypothetical protein
MDHGWRPAYLAANTLGTGCTAEYGLPMSPDEIYRSMSKCPPAVGPDHLGAYRRAYELVMIFPD